MQVTLLLKNKIRYIFFIIMLSIMALLSGTIYTYSAQKVFQTILSKQEMLKPILLLAAVLCAVLILKMLIGMSSFFLEKESTISLQNLLLQSLYSTNYFLDYTRKENINLIYQNAEGYCNTYYKWLQSFIVNSVILITTSIYLARIDYKVLIGCIIILALLLTVSISNQKRVKDLQSDFMEKNNHTTAIGWEHILNREVSSVLNYNKIFKNYNKNIIDLNDSMIEMKKTLFKNQYMGMFGIILANFFTALFGGILCFKNVISMVDLFGMVTLISVASRAVLSIPVVFDQRNLLKGMYEPIRKFLQISPYLEEEKENMTEKIEEIMVKDLSLKVGKKDLLEQVSFQLKAGKIYMLSGESGCGKTTLLRAMMGLYPIEQGQIFYQKKLLECLNRDSIWDKISYLPQIPIILPATLERNITGEEKDFDREKFLKLVKKFKIEQFIGQQLQEEKLSSGERQKVAACRCFYKDSDILFLDEPTSAMDRESEIIFREELRSYIKERNAIAIFISHRQSDLKQGDMQLWIENQKIEVRKL